MSWVIVTLVVLTGLFFSALFSGAETGFYCISRIRLQLGVHEQDPAAVRLARLVDDTTSVVSATLIGTNLMNYVTTSAVAFLFAEMLGFDEVSTEVYTILVLTPIVFVVGEVVPKALFQQHPYRLLRRSVGLLAMVSFAFRMTGMIGLLRALTSVVERAVGGTSRADREATPKRRMAALLQEGLVGHAHADDQSELIDRICRLSETTVRAVMVPRNRVYSITAGTSRRELLRVARRTTFSRLPVFETRRSHIIGVVDIVRLLCSDDWATVSDCLEPITTVGAHESVASATALAQRNGERIAVVTDSEGLMVGIVTLRDLTEEIVGGLAETV